jgi:signal transduction histidine kinase
VIGIEGIAAPSSEDFVGPWSLGTGVGLLLLLLAAAAAIVSIAALAGVAPLLRRFTRSLLLTAPAAGSPAREMLAESLGDVTLSIAYWLPDRELFVDESGIPVEMPEPGSRRAWTSVDSGGRRVAAIIHDAELDASPELVQAAAVGASLALDNERLKADLRARLEELRASRVRIVQAGDLARRRLERDLHDGAQQQLVALSIDLRLLKGRVAAEPETAALIDAATQKLADALSELRELARGIHPAILTERGLGPAVAALARRMPMPVDCKVGVDGRLPDATEAAAYFVVSEGLANVAKYAKASNVSVRLTELDRVLEVEVADDGVGGASTRLGTGLSGLSDRVSALDGVLTIVSPPGKGTRLVARIPSGRHSAASVNGSPQPTREPA